MEATIYITAWQALAGVAKVNARQRVCTHVVVQIFPIGAGWYSSKLLPFCALEQYCRKRSADICHVIMHTQRYFGASVRLSVHC